MLVQQSFQIQDMSHVPSHMLEDMLSLITDTLPHHHINNRLLSRSKFILTELVTNAIKHANTGVTDINIQVTETSIRFIKSDSGDKLSIPEIKDELTQGGTVITKDMMHTLYAVNKNDKKYFYCYEHDVPFIETEYNYPEHFGLLIITKSSDEFYYAYDNTDNLNIFSVTLNY